VGIEHTLKGIAATLVLIKAVLGEQKEQSWLLPTAVETGFLTQRVYRDGIRPLSPSAAWHSCTNERERYALHGD
jgi:hypothetical protein